MPECRYCGSDLAHYDPVTVQETRGDESVEVGGFCNYACLDEWIRDTDRLTGACCTIDP